MRLIEDRRDVLRKAWSVRLMLVAGALSGAEIALPLLEGFVDMPRGAFAALSGLATAAAFVARLLAQRDENGRWDNG